ncbi:MAG: hypothetical protein ACE10G_14445 [Gemmatimonadales bacterium]
MNADAAFAALREANPVPDAARFEQTRSSSAAFLQATIERSEHMTRTVKNKQQTRVEPEPEATGRDPVGLPRRRQGGRGPLVAIAAVVVVLVIGAAAAILTLSGDGGDDVVAASPTTPGPVTSFADIAGTIYQRQNTGPYFVSFFEDGTYNYSTNPDLVVDRPSGVFQTSFEDTKILITTANSFCGQPDQGGTYEVLVLENGNLMFVAVDEDSCGLRSGNFSNTEWVPIP